MNQFIQKNTEPLLYVPDMRHAITFLLFTANWCAACKDINAMFDEKSKQLHQLACFEKFNVDDKNSDHITIQYKIIKIPTIIIMVNGKIKNYINDHITEELFNETIKMQTKKDVIDSTNISISQ